MAVARAAHSLTNGVLYMMGVAIDSEPPTSENSRRDMPTSSAGAMALRR